MSATVSIKGSGNKYYEVNLTNLTCNCRDFQYRRHNFNIDDPRRLCKHLKEAIDLNSEIQNQSDDVLKTKGFSREFVDKLIPDLNNILNSDDNVLSYKLCGDYRRGCSSVSDIIYVAYVMNMSGSSSLMKSITNLGVYSVSKSSKSSFEFIGPDGILLIIKLVDSCSYPFMTLYNTGPTEFLVKLKSTLKRKLKLGLNEYGFIEMDGSITTNDLGTEEEILEYLGFEYLSPDNR